MADNTGIEWTDRTWNPTTGCDRVSPGCDHCYAMTMAKRLKGMGSAKYQRDGDPLTSGPGFGIQHHSPVVGEPLRWKKPQRIFVNSMSDLFHDGIPDGFIAAVWATMKRCPHHTFQVLTKRHARMRSLLSSDGFREMVFARCGVARDQPCGHLEHYRQWPLPNVWLGVSAENQQWADIRVPALLDTPAAVRFISAEPLLGPLSIFASSKIDRDPGLDWVIAGGESGRGARPMHPSWVRALRDECAGASVPFLFKQWGEYRPLEHPDDDSAHLYVQHETGRTATDDDMWHISTGHWWGVRREGKHRAGRELDGQTWDQYPEAVLHA